MKIKILLADLETKVISDFSKSPFGGRYKQTSEKHGLKKKK